METNTQKLYDDCTNDAADHLRRAHAYARNWDWNLAEQELNKAYADVGATNPGTGTDFHTGNHPIQGDDGFGNSIIDILMGMWHER